MSTPILILGEEFQSGVYLLHLHVHQPLAVACGRFNRGQPLFFQPGDYVYVGSALGARGAPLANRLVRHATRSAGRPPHALRTILLEQLALGDNHAIHLRPKKLFWHVDYVLDELAVELCGVIALRTACRLEGRLAQWLNADSCTFVIEKGLGASDHHGATHLLGVQAGEDWWSGLAESAQQMLKNEQW
ncbi:MAG: DUF123 domain-containing protein [Caldilineaceae bacterium]